MPRRQVRHPDKEMRQYKNQVRRSKQKYNIQIKRIRQLKHQVCHPNKNANQVHHMFKRLSNTPSKIPNTPQKLIYTSKTCAVVLK